MFWLARQFENSAVSDFEHDLIQQYRASAEHIVWYLPPSGNARKTLDLDRWFRSPVDIIVMRSAWNDPNALFLGAKAGYNQVNHGHLDLGNFELDALGVRWARDLGSDDYNLPGYFEKKKGGRRWLYFRNVSESHSVPLIGGRGQDELGTAKVRDFQSTPDGARVTIDLTEAYKDRAASVVRDLALTNNRRAAVVRDRVRLNGPAEVEWGMTTDAEIALGDPGTAELTLEGKKLRARIMEPEGAVFSIGSCEQQKPQKENKGVKRLLVRLPSVNNSVTITIVLAPHWNDGPVEATDLTGLPK
jgi:hypothetical protein